jgi:hypothetical protein
VTIPPVVAVTVPIAVPIPRVPRENVFLPVTTKMIISVPKVVRVPEIISVPEVASGISLIPHTGDSWISVIRESREAIGLISLVNGCSGVRPGMCKCCSV